MRPAPAIAVYRAPETVPAGVLLRSACTGLRDLGLYVQAEQLEGDDSLPSIEAVGRVLLDIGAVLDRAGADSWEAAVHRVADLLRELARKRRARRSA